MDISNLKEDGDGYPAMDIVKRDPTIAAALSKLEKSRDSITYDTSGNRSTSDINTMGFKSVLAKRAKRNSDAKAIIKLLPDIALAKQIMVSCILSPKDMASTELIYNIPKDVFSSELASSLSSCIKKHFDEKYNAATILPTVVEEALFDKGSYAIAVIPENSIDDLINSGNNITTESLSPIMSSDGSIRNIGVLGNYVNNSSERVTIKNALESYLNKTTKTQNIDSRIHYRGEGLTGYENHVACESLTVTDNPLILRLPKIVDRLNSKLVKDRYSNNALSIAGESFNKNNTGLTDSEIDKLVYRTRVHKQEPVVAMKSAAGLKRKSVGAPLIMKLPSESVIPVHVPGNPKQHIGFFVMLDQNGNPVESPDGDDGFSSTANAGQNNLAGSMIRKVETNMGLASGGFDYNNNQQVATTVRMYSDMVERDLISRVKNGVYNSDVSIAKNEEVYRIMLSRVLAKKFTQILYLPVEFVTYIAFDYTDEGIGKGILDDASVINAQRVVLNFTDMTGSIKNAIGRTKVSVNIPENDPNPQKTAEKLMDEVVRSRVLNLPTGITNPADITEYIQRHGYEWEFTGNKGLPDLKVEFQQVNSNYQKVDSDLHDRLRKDSISICGLSPELVDNGFNSEFATTATANNILLQKRVMQKQDILMPQYSDHLRKIANSTQSLVDELKELIEADLEGVNIELDDVFGHPVEVNEDVSKKLIVNKALQTILTGFWAELPKPSSSTTQTQFDEVKAFMDGIEEVISAYYSADFITAATAGKISEQVETTKAALKAYYVRKFMSERGILTELAGISREGNENEDQDNLSNELQNHISSITKLTTSVFKGLQKTVTANNKVMDSIEALTPPEESATSTGSDEQLGVVDDTIENSDDNDSSALIEDDLGTV